jgi:1,4-dihydroxy-2-naphthoyl-CoA hydrolase
MSESLWKKPVSVESINKLHDGCGISHLGIEWTEIGPDYMVARMPVDQRTVQPYGLLAGGANVLLAETLASCAAISSLPEGQLAVGIEVNANHLKAERNGHVIGTCRPVHLGSSMQVWQVEVKNEKGTLVCISRVTLSVLTKP